ncbi:HlyD family secretion protein [Shewanella xiamenensis]|uniref:HlyD family secretion protein n=1 Tax=Shewanella xiamenensis TaxID=332186 RepID=UPI00166AB4BB|nr:HlyD family secretion protein [Shewanella xiamenensis]MCL1072222.1 HlyD family secretion protein [Shewanella xiamenensis]MEE1981581.1 HlyD family secretion protein [Shewanella xiamenensis]WHF55277.1 HlyD family secretion protein [Shewanella xiamenensis]GGN00279.1 multidrug transporter [Shewanella xiamenensis]
MSENNTKMSSEQDDKKINQARSFTYYIFTLFAALWLYTLWADRITPMTDQARVNGQLIRISPEVSGPISQVHIINNSSVKTGDPLVTIDPRPFELAVKAAKFDLQQAAQSYEADSAAISVAQANEVAARIKVDNAKKNVERNRILAEKGTISQASMDDIIAKLETAQAGLVQASSALDKAKQEFGPRGIDNPEIQSVLNRQEQALLDLNRTKLLAPADGVITNMNVAVGHYASTGQPILTFINNNNPWLTAMVRENSLAHLKPGDKVKIVFDAHPGDVFEGQISSIGWGSSGNGSLAEDASNGLMTSPTSSSKAQRFPVNIEFKQLPDNLELRYGGRAVVGFYPDESYLGERLQDLWIWAWSYISYVS